MAREKELIESAYIRGHPMWTPLAKDMAKETGVAVFGGFPFYDSPLRAEP
jgi:hypothetical protein